MKYVPNPPGVRELLNSDEMQELMVDRAQVGAEYVAERAPVVTGEYLASIDVDRDRAGDRVAATLTATAPYAQRVEQKHHVFAGVVDQIENT